MKKTSNNILLDTHVWLWLLSQPKKIVHSPLEKLIRSKESTCHFFLSVISLWEIGNLIRKKRIVLKNKNFHYFKEKLDAFGVTLLALDPDIAFESGTSQEPLLQDPADRIITYQAQKYGLTLASADAQILQFAKQNKLPTLSI